VNEPIDPVRVDHRTDAQVSLSNDIDACIKRHCHEFDLTLAEIIGVLENVKSSRLFDAYMQGRETSD
jgi:hypothetical protein